MMVELLLSLAVGDLTQEVLTYCHTHNLAGITSLPDELLCKILEYTAIAQGEDTTISTRSTSAVLFSHISKRFSRPCHCDSAYNWCHLSSAFTQPMVHCFLSRSKLLPLHISLSGPALGHQCRDADPFPHSNILLLASHSQRWKTLTVQDESHFRALRGFGLLLVLSQLETL